MDDEPRDQTSGRSNDFTERLERARASIQAREQEPSRRRSSYDFGIRVATEMAVAVAVGFGFGWYLDKWLGTRPWMLLLFLPLGAAAGIMNVMRAARVEAARQQAELARNQSDETNRGDRNQSGP